MESLCPADLFHYHGLLVERRTRELRELLNVQVAAAAVTVDRGEAYRKLNDALDGSAEAAPAEEAPRPRGTPEQEAAVAAVFASAGPTRRRSAAP